MANVIDLQNISLDSLKKDTETQSKKTTKIFDEKNYLNVRLDSSKGETTKELTIRLLPIDKDSPFVNVHFHNLKVPKEISASGYKSYLCLEKNEGIDHEKFGTKCPFCELNRMAYKKFEEETDPLKKENYKKISIANIAREAKIVRCIERGKENEGVKFWKFNVRSDKTDPYHAIKSLAETRNKEALDAGDPNGQNILSIFKEDGGRDLKVTITEGTSAPQIIDVSVPTPLSKDPALMEAWIKDEKKWQDVFTPKSYEYLQLVADNKIPWYDKDQKKWIDKEDHDANVKGAHNAADEEIKAAEKALTQATQPQVDDIIKSVSLGNNDDEELPF